MISNIIFIGPLFIGVAGILLIYLSGAASYLTIMNRKNFPIAVTIVIFLTGIMAMITSVFLLNKYGCITINI